MALPTETVEIPFDGGLKQGEESLLQTQGWQQIENCIRTKDGGFRKLRGFAPLSSAFDTGAVSTAQSCVDVPSAARTLSNPRIITVSDSIGYASNGTLYLNAANASLPRVPIASVSPWVAELSTIRALNNQARFDVCRANAIVYYATVNNNSTGEQKRIVITSRREDTGELMSESTVSAAGWLSGVRVIPWGDTPSSSKALLVYREDTSIKWFLLSDGKLTTTGGTLAAGVPNNTPFDIFGDAIAHVLYTAIATSSTVIRLERWNIASTTAVTSIGSVTRAYGDPITAIALTYNSDTDRLLLCVADWFVNRNRVTSVVLFGGTLLQVNPQITVYESAPAVSPNTTSFDACIKQIACAVVGSVHLWYVGISVPNQANRGGSANSVQFTIGIRVAADGTSADTGDRIYNARMCSRLYVDNASQRVYFLAHLTRNGGFGSDPNSGVVIAGHPGMNTNSVAPYGSSRLIPFGFLAYGTAQVYGPETGISSSGYFEQLATPYVDSRGALHFSWRDEENGVVRIRDVSLVADARVGVHVQFGAQTYIAGAMLYQWDGYRAFEANFLQIPYVAGPSYAAGALAPGTRYYKVTYLRVSKSGEQTRSRPSNSVAYTNGVGNLNVVAFNRINVTAAQAAGEFEEIYYEIWRTKAGTTSPFYLVTRLQATRYDIPSGATPLALATGEHVTYNDAIDDASLRPLALAQDGSSGAELANDPPPSAAHLCAWAGRLWLTDGERVWYSKERATDRSAEFSFLQSFGRGALESPIVALARCGETLAVFTAKETGYVYGSPAAANGDDSSLVGPILAQNIGCLHPAAVCNIPQGALVPTQYGVQLFTLAREYQPVGVDAEEHLHLSGVALTSAVYDQVDDLAWFCAGDRFVLLDVGRMQWSTAFTGSNPVSVAFADDRLVMSTPSLIRMRDPSDGDDDYVFAGSPYAQQIETPWFKAGGVLGEMRARKLWLLAQRYGDSGLRVEVAFNYDPTWVDSVTFAPGSFATLEGEPATIIRLPLPRQRCRSFKVRITETANGATESQGWGFLALRLAFSNRGATGAHVKEANSGGGL